MRTLPFSWDELESADLVWLLEVEIAGSVYRFATEPVHVMTEGTDGLPAFFAYHGGLDDLEHSVNAEPFGEGDVEPTSKASITWRSGSSTFAEVVGNQQDPSAGRVELALHRVGDLWEDRDVVFAGRVDSVEHGASADPVELQFVLDFVTDRNLIPAANKKVTMEGWYVVGSGAVSDFTPDTGVLEQAYPVPIGYPGDLGGDFFPTTGLTTTNALGVPGLIVRVSEDTRDNNDAPSLDYAYILISAYPTDVGKQAGTVGLRNVTTSTTVNATCYNLAPVGGAGNRYGPELVSVARVDVVSTTITEGDEVWCAFQSLNGGGVLNQRGDGPLRGAGEVIRWLLEQTDIPVDVQGSRSALDLLDQYKLDFYWNTHRPAWEVLVEDLAPLLPFGWEVTGRGVRIVYWDAWADLADATFEVNPTRYGGARSSPVARSSVGEVANEIDLRYWLSGDGDYKLSRTIGPDRTRSSSEPGSPYSLHPLALASATRYGIRPTEPVMAACIQDPSTAFRSAEYLLRKRCATFRRVSYVLPKQYQSIQTGQVGIINDDTVPGLQNVLVVAHDVTRTSGETSIAFRELPEWIRSHAGHDLLSP
jgi:hypothetical protein